METIFTKVLCGTIDNSKTFSHDTFISEVTEFHNLRFITIFISFSYIKFSVTTLVHLTFIVIKVSITVSINIEGIAQHDTIWQETINIFTIWWVFTICNHVTTCIKVIGISIESNKGRFSLITTCTEVSDSLTIIWEPSNSLFISCQLKRNEVTFFSDSEIFTSCFIAKYIANTAVKNVCSVEVFSLPLFQFNRIINWFTSWDHVFREHFRVLSFKFS